MSTFTKPSKSQLVAMNRLRMSDLSPVMTMMEAALEDVKGALLTAIDPVHIHRLQGRAQVLKDFLDLAENASQILERSQ